MLNIQVIILAAGKGTRMYSPLPKVLHHVGGLPLLGHVVQAVEKLSPLKTTVVLSPHLPEVEHYVQSYSSVKTAYQHEALGTAHAVLCGLSKNDIDAPILILFGDTPLIQAETLENFIQEFLTLPLDTAAMVVGIKPNDSKNYGRILLNESQEISEIVEAKGASNEVLAQNLCNSGVMILKGSLAESLLKSIEKNYLSQEYYLTDVVKVARAQGHKVKLYVHDNAEELEGVNNCVELADIETCLQKRWRHRAMMQGVSMVDPESVYLSYDTILASGVKLYPHIFFGPGVQIEAQVEIFPFTHIEGTIVKQNSKIGPYARLRPGCVIEKQSKIGNFVEMKNTHLGTGSKVNHLSYLGDAQIGENTNIGAGTITANFDGYQKWSTKIGQKVSVGANCSLVAPLTIGDGAIIGAGSTVTKDVSDQTLVIARTPQKNFDQKGQEHRLRAQNSKTSTTKGND
ncbi:MAG: bifunctional UDP-N-acetylglucosamine diphosphorylase/glucosamine-1-phosphate N-acetyltransferase GlmU [Janthinobacterium lividum]